MLVVLWSVQQKNKEMVEAHLPLASRNLPDQCILYCLTHSEGSLKLSLRKFKQKLITQLQEQAVKVVIPGRPKLPNNLERFQGNKHLVTYVEDDRNCVVCTTPAKCKRTNFASGCTGNPHLHLKDCFLSSIHLTNLNCGPLLVIS